MSYIAISWFPDFATKILVGCLQNLGSHIFHSETSTSIQAHHQSYIDVTTAKYTNVACHFCITFKKEEGGNKSKATSNVEYFESFRTNHYLSRLQGQHLLKLINSTNNLLCSCNHIVKDMLSRVQLSMAII